MQSVNFQGSTRDFDNWPEFEAACTSKVVLIQFAEQSEWTLVWGYDGPEVLTSRIWSVAKPEWMDETTYQQHVVWLADFRSKKSGYNKAIVLRTADGRTDIRVTAAKRTANYCQRYFYFETSAPTSVVNQKADGTDYGDVTYKMFDVNGVETTVIANCVRTEVDFAPKYNYEIIGGAIDIDPTVKGATTKTYWMSVMALPNIPPSMGGQITYMSRTSMEMATSGRYACDGRSISYMPYMVVNSVNQGTNVLRVRMWHPAGAIKRFQLLIEHFV